MIWQNNEQIQQTLEAVFDIILAERMRGLPVVNNSLSVQAVDFSRLDEDWLGILITPWFMNLMLLPGPGSSWNELQAGATIDKQFPYAAFEFTLATEEQLGTYAFCSLFSPMFRFESQTAALTTAQSSLHALLAKAAPRGISRRDLLRGNLGISR